MKYTSCLHRATLLCLSLILAISLLTIHAHAASVEEIQTCGWVEVQATVPEGFQEDISVNLQAADGSSVTIYVLPENNYVGRAEVAYGTYDVMSAGVVNDTKMTYPTDWSPYSIEVAPSASAVLISVTVTPSDGYSPIVPSDPIGAGTEESQPATESEGESVSSGNSANTIDSGSTDADAPTPENTDFSTDKNTPEQVQEYENGIISVVRTIAVSLTGMAVFIGIICAAVYLVRKNEWL